MNYFSTRDPNRERPFSFAAAVEMGLAPDGGLFVPQELPPVGKIDRPQRRSFHHVAEDLLQPFMENEISPNNFKKIVREAFDFPIELEMWDEKTYVLNLTKGPTAAFKDVGARFLAAWMSYNKIPKTVLVATSGDTGGAVASAFFGNPLCRVALLFPKAGVSALQKKQLTGWGQNILSLEIAGSFDDAQKIVKTLLSDRSASEELGLTSANSISLARLLPQACYYAYASLRYQDKTGKPARFVVPTGNMGNVVAGLWAARMGYPIERIRIATNSNLTLSDFWKNKKFEPRLSVRTLANAMDVGNPSNFERYAHLAKQFPDAKLISDVQPVSDQQIKKTILEVFKAYGRAICPHTACSFAVKDSEHAEIIVQTADAAKFAETVQPLIGLVPPVPESLKNLLERRDQYQTITADPDEVRSAIENFVLRPNP